MKDSIIMVQFTNTFKALFTTVETYSMKLLKIKNSCPCVQEKFIALYQRWGQMQMHLHLNAF